jgi:acetyl-CoA C-acetyltransferase
MPTVDLKRAAAIVGIHEHVTRYAPDKSELQIQGESVIKAVEDAGLTKKDIDGLLTAGNIRNSGLNLADYLNMYPKMVDNTTVGGGSFEFHLSHALNAIAAGRINCAVITYSSLARSGGISVGTGGVARFGHPRLDPSPDSFEELYGLTTVGLYAMIAQRHMHLYGTTSEQLAEVAVAMRKHASMNPEALFRDPITVEDVVNSRVISTPLHLPDCCVITDGGGAVVVASAEVARYCRHTPVWVLGAGEAVAHQGAGKRDLQYIAAKQSHEPAFTMAGVTQKDIDMAMIYDSFTITVLEALEDLGFCKKGEGGDFVSEGRLQVGGELPINTDGGGLSSNHPGMRGIFLLLEATRQLRHQFEGTPRQVSNCQVALCHGTGGALGSRHSGGTVILGRD